jgi:dihydrofolate reductase
MRKVLVSNLISLDNKIARPNGDLDWFKVDQEYFDYTSAEPDRRDLILFGRVTYEGMASYWTSAEAAASQPDFTEQMNSTHKIVFSRTLKSADWINTRLVKDDLVGEITRLKQQPGKDIAIFGSGTIVSQLTEAGFIDEYQIVVNPLIIGAGIPEFTGITHNVKLKLMDSKTFKNGVVLLKYEPARD